MEKHGIGWDGDENGWDNDGKGKDMIRKDGMEKDEIMMIISSRRLGEDMVEEVEMGKT